MDSSSIPCKTFIRSDYPVAWHDDANRIMTNCAANRLCGHSVESALLCDFFRDPSIRDRFSIRNLAHDLTDTVAEIGAYQMDLREKAGIMARKINIQPFFRLIKIVRFTMTSSFLQTKPGISGAFFEPKTC